MEIDFQEEWYGNAPAQHSSLKGRKQEKGEPADRYEKYHAAIEHLHGIVTQSGAPEKLEERTAEDERKIAWRD